jgi:hypothetical protein
MEEDEIYGVKPYSGEEKSLPINQVLPDEGLGTGEMPVQTAMQARAQEFKPLTPRRMGQYLEERTLPSFEENRVRAQNEQAQREAGARMNLGSLSAQSEQLGIPPEYAQKALAGFGSAADVATFGLYPYAPAAGAKVLGKFGVSGYERYADMPLVEAKKEAEAKLKAAQTVEPGAALTGQVSGFVGGAKATPVIAPTRGPAVSGALTGALYGGISGGAQEGSLIDAIKGVGIGAVGGAALAPVAERMASGLTRLFTGGRPVIDEAGNLTAEAIKIARSAGYSPEEIQLLAPQLQQVFEQRGLTIPAAKEARFREFGVEPKPGMVTKDSAQLAKEQKFGMVTKESDQLAKEQKFGDYKPQADQMTQAAEDFVGGAQAPLRDAIDAAVARGRSGAAALNTKIQKAYDEARTLAGTGGFSKESITDLGEKLRVNWASNPKTMNLYANDAASEAAKKLDSVLGVPLPSNIPGVGSVTNRTFEAVEGGRRVLNDALSLVKNKTDGAAIRKLIDDFDDHVERSINNGAFSGDPKVLDAWKDARKLFSEYQRKFGVRKTGEESGSLFKTIIQENKSSEDVAGMMFNFAKGDPSMKSSALKTWNELRRALGPNSPELENIKKSFVLEIMRPNEASQQGFSQVAKQVNTFLTGNAASFSRRVLSPAERSGLARYSAMMKEAGRTPDPGSNPRLGLMGQSFFASVPPAISTGAGYLGYLDPVMAAVLGGFGAVGGYMGAVKGSDFMAARAANRPPSNVPRGYTFPSARVAPVMGAQAVPGLEQTVPPVVEDFKRRQQLAPEEQRAAGGRAGRATGGRVGVDVEADALVRAADRAKKDFNRTTEPLLNTPDNHIAKALEVANRAI